MNLLTTLLLATLTLGPDAGKPKNPESSPIRLVTGNLSVDIIQHSAIGAHPDPAFRGGPPSLEELVGLREQGLHGYEDYIAWGTVESVEGSFDWTHHEAVAQRLAEAGLPYIPYIWCHFPPTWLRDDERATLMRCNAHGEPCNMLSIFDPRTLDWYERFYRELYAHFGDRIGETYACILGPYGEGNYPLPYVNWVVNLGHCHEGYWCGDPYALPLFQKAMRDKYGTLASLNAAWKSGLKSFEEIGFPPEIAAEAVPSFEDRPAAERRRWLDFIHWYHQALIDFAGGAVDRAAKAFGIGKIAIKPGGNAGWMNPLSWGTYNPGFARMASRRGIAMQTADSRGVYWADQWTSTAYRFYGVPYRTESAGNLDRPTFIKRTFTDASCGSSRLFTYEIRKFLPDCRRSLHLYSGERSLTDVALLAPTTSYYLDGDVLPAIHRGEGLRDLIDYHVLDELLVADGALRPYRLLAADDCRVVESGTLRKIHAWVKKGGLLVWSCAEDVTDVEGSGDWPINRATAEGVPYGRGRLFRVKGDSARWTELVLRLAYHSHELPRGPKAMPALDGRSDRVWTSEFADRLILLNVGSATASKTITWRGVTYPVELPPAEIVELSAPGN